MVGPVLLMKPPPPPTVFFFLSFYVRLVKPLIYIVADTDVHEALVARVVTSAKQIVPQFKGSHMRGLP